MAGAGYKLFNTGDVLTAAQVNTYLMEQTVMVFDDAAARTTALSGVVSEGMISYLKDTNAVEVYNGSAWVASDDPNAIQNSIVDAKGDLIAASANDTPARLAVGNNGDTLVADSSASTGLRWQGDFSAGRNKLINGDLAINQRSFTSSTSTGYGFDRWLYTTVGGTCTYSAETFTLGTAPVSGYEARNFARIVTSGQSAAGDVTIFRQYIEGVRTLAGQTATVSFWAKAGSGTPKVAVELTQYFGDGSGGSAGVDTYLGQATLSTAWQRFSFTVSVPSISGKTLSTTVGTDSFRLNLFVSAGSNFNSRTGSLGIQSATFDFWGLQVEAGSVATAFQTATGTLAGELAACQRYFQRLINGADNSNEALAVHQVRASTGSIGTTQFIVPMRTAPSFTASAAGDFRLTDNVGNEITATALAYEQITPRRGRINVTVASGLTAGNATFFKANSATATLDASAEL